MNTALIFDPDEAYDGTYVTDDVEYKAYQVTYVANPFADEFEVNEFLNRPSAFAASCHKMNIRIPVRHNNNWFSEEEIAKAPILFFIPWGGDAGSGAFALNQFGAGMLDNAAYIHRALNEGWVVVEPGMRGVNCYSGMFDTPEYRNYGKLPRPIADLKAALRYLRYGSNAVTIPGDKDRIFVMGFSSGGCASSMLGVSGNTTLYDEYLEEIGAAPGRDDVFASAPSCPIITRHHADPALAWERWGDLSGVSGADPMNVRLCNAFSAYQNGLGLRATIDGIADTPLTTVNLTSYMLSFMKKGAIKYLNALGGKDAIDAYLVSKRDADLRFGIPGDTIPRDWINPVYDEETPELVADLDCTWQDMISYIVDPLQTDPAVPMAVQYDKPFTCPTIKDDGLLSFADGGDGYLIPGYATLSSPSFGKPGDYAAVYSDFGWDFITDASRQGVTLSDEYRAWIQFQRNSVDPLYFLLGGAGDCDIAPHWFLRTGAVDFAPVRPMFFNLVAGLEMKGKNTDAAITWDQGHALTNDIDGFFSFANSILK